MEHLIFCLNNFIENMILVTTFLNGASDICVNDFIENLIFATKLLSSPRKGLRAESARAVTGRQCPHSGVGEDFLACQLVF